jgi:ABC-2 type transport system permease protein
MNTQANAMHEPLQGQNLVPTTIPASRAFYWSVRRELWENRSIYMAPLAVATVVVFAFSISSIMGIWEPRLRLVPSRPQMPYDMAAGVMTRCTASVVIAASCSGNHCRFPMSRPCSLRRAFL